MANAVNMQKRVRRAKLIWNSLVVLGTVAVVLAVENQFIGPAYYSHQQGAEIIRAESSALPPYPGSEVVEDILYNEPFDSPRLLIQYAYEGVCQQVEAYYNTFAPSEQWASSGEMKTYPDPQHPNARDQDLLSRGYHKTIAGYTLDLNIECYAISVSYTVGIDVT